MKDIVKKVNSSFDLAVLFFLFSGCLYFIYYSLLSSKIVYIPLSILIYFISYFLRHHIFKVKSKKGFTEPGIFFISFLFLAYLLLITKVDNEVENYLPNKLLLQSGVSFLFIFLITFLSNLKKEISKFIFVLLLIVILTLVQLNTGYINHLIDENDYLVDYIVGFPIIYLGLIISGLDNLFLKLQKSSQHPPPSEGSRS